MKYGFCLVLCLAGCGSDSDADGAKAGSGGSAGSVATGGSAGSVASGGSAGSIATGGSAGSVASGGSGGSAGGAAFSDPTQAGPFSTTAFDGTATVTATGHSVPMHCVVPDDVVPHPLVIIAHGFQLPASQYYGYALRLGSHGYVACTADFPAGFSPNHAQSAQDLSGALDWVLGANTAAGNPLSGKVDPALVGVMGHSLGGKLAVLAAASDTRFRAVLGLDPVDSSMLCNPTDCPDASSALPLPIPTAFLGETLDATAGLGGQACAPAADNFQTFYANATAPSYGFTLNGANHMSFLDDPSTCGLVCSFCQPATLSHDDAIGIARATTVAFFERRLRNRPEYESFLTGADVNALWVASGKLAIESK
jgi:predicted dienelactone hydrolase